MKKNLMLYAAMTAAVGLAACEPSLSAPVGENLASPLGLQPAADYKTVTWKDDTYLQSHARSYPLIDSWTYTKAGETVESFSSRIEVQRYKKVDAAEIFRQMQEAVANRAKDSDMASRTICFENDTEGKQVREASIWRYADVTDTKGKRQTYATGVMYRFANGPAFESFMNRDFLTACRGMRNQAVIAPPALS